jgi:hypothetical protein
LGQAADGAWRGVDVLHRGNWGRQEAEWAKYEGKKGT